MKKILFGMVLGISIMFGESFTDNSMKKVSQEALDGTRDSFTTRKLVEHIFTIEQRGEFEKKEDWDKRVEAFSKDGIFLFYEQATKVRYDIDNEKMEFTFPINWHYTDSILFRGDWIGNTGRYLYFIAGNEKKGFIGEKFKKRLDADSKASQERGSEVINMSINMSPEEAKLLKSDENNAFFILYAIEITGKDIEKRQKKEGFGIESRISGLFLGTSVVVSNGKDFRKTLLSYGLDGNK